MQNKWSKISNFCIERNNLYISRYVLADGANRYVLWNGTKMIKIHDNAQELKNEAMAIIERESGKSGELFGTVNSIIPLSIEFCFNSVDV